MSEGYMPQAGDLGVNAYIMCVLFQLQQAEMEEMRQREANLTALAAIGPRKKKKLEDSAVSLLIRLIIGVGTFNVTNYFLCPSLS